jgi:hypothetical protein
MDPSEVITLAKLGTMEMHRSPYCEYELILFSVFASANVSKISFSNNCGILSETVIALDKDAKSSGGPRHADVRGQAGSGISPCQAQNKGKKRLTYLT